MTDLQGWTNEVTIVPGLVASQNLDCPGCDAMLVTEGSPLPIELTCHVCEARLMLSVGYAVKEEAR